MIYYFGIGMADIVLLVILAIFIFITLWSYSIGGEPGILIIIVLISLGATLYINYIPYGVYQSKVVKVNDIVIGENTPASKPFILNIDKNYVRIGKEPRIPLCKNKSNFYVTVYCNKHSYITITKMGTVKERLLEWKPSDLIREIEVNY